MRKLFTLILLLTLGLFVSFSVMQSKEKVAPVPSEISEASVAHAHENSEAHAAEYHYHHHAPTDYVMPVSPRPKKKKEEASAIHYNQEVHLQNIRQLTYGGENAEAYFSFDDDMLVLQVSDKKRGINCDQIFYGRIPQGTEPFDMKMVSTGRGRTTCSYFLPGDRSVLYASTHKADRNCPPEPDFRKSRKYLWPLYRSFEIYYADLNGNVTQQLTKNNVYDAEATVSPDGNKIVFTSTRDGDIDLYVMDVSGKDVRRITFGLGYDGGAFFSPDSKQILFRASRPRTAEDQREYKELLRQNLVAPTKMELYICNVDGSNLRQITNLGNANWAPFFHPSGQKVVFSSNHRSKRGFPFNIFMINVDGTGLEQITFDNTFDSFPMFSNDGKKLVFSSNRNNGGTRDTNVFIADWVD